MEDNTIQGVFNAASPEFITNAEFMKTLAKDMKRPFFFPRIPAFLLRLFMGEAAGMILEGSRISSQKIIDTGYQFLYPTTGKAIQASRRDIVLC